ncbi:MAG TPA: response regulator transcription factor [Oscillatoriales cyanobacterium M4454_W2019_049]|nr:MAG: DNA-binding response regulator [Cyanobacteria bacterium J055]HIK33614.1 response regulator transcription factor [Oscillatoriales cyanobacterium M4454_W2019_049]
MNAATLDRSACVLLVETDETLAQHISLDLQDSGYAPIVARDAASGLDRMEELQPGLVAIDRTLPGKSGLWLCSYLRQQGHRTPVLMMMGGDSVADRVACLEAGADDYLLKPYQSDRFLNLVKFYLQPAQGEVDRLRFGDLTLDLTTRQAVRQERAIDLTMKEFELLKFLMEHPREVLTREQILENVWGYDFMGESNVIEVYIRYLRLKIEEEGQKRLIQTVRGVGYVLRDT